MKITLPEGFTPPSNARPDEPFEVVATLRQSEDGGFSLTAIDGIELGEEEEENEDPEIRLPFEEDEEML